MEPTATALDQLADRFQPAQVSQPCGATLDLLSIPSKSAQRTQGHKGLLDYFAPPKAAIGLRGRTGQNDTPNRLLFLSAQFGPAECSRLCVAHCRLN